jgi:hypothetical protein
VPAGRSRRPAPRRAGAVLTKDTEQSTCASALRASPATTTGARAARARQRSSAARRPRGSFRRCARSAASAYSVYSFQSLFSGRPGRPVPRHTARQRREALQVSATSSTALRQDPPSADELDRAKENVKGASCSASSRRRRG